MKLGHFSDKAIDAAKQLLSDSIEFSELETMDFTRCQRPDGTFYGTSGQCRKGKEAGAKEKQGESGGESAKSEPKMSAKDAKTVASVLGASADENLIWEESTGPKIKNAKDAIKYMSSLYKTAIKNEAEYGTLEENLIDSGVSEKTARRLSKVAEKDDGQPIHSISARLEEDGWQAKINEVTFGLADAGTFNNVPHYHFFRVDE